MDEKKSTRAEWIGNTSTHSSIQHYALIYPKKFKQKPSAETGLIHNSLKRNPYAKPYTLQQIVEAFCSGQTLVLAMVERELKNPADKEKVSNLDINSKEWADCHINKFKSTQLLGIDIDDTYSVTSIQDVLSHFKGRVSAAYYSFSHGRANDRGGFENRYRLLFQFDSPITDDETAKEIVKLIKSELLQLYPTFPAKNIDTMFPTSLWHGSNRPPVYVDEAAVLETSKYTAAAENALQAKREALKARKNNLSKDFKFQSENPVTFEELKGMAEAIGHIPTGTGQNDRWTNLGISIRWYEFAGHITFEEGYQLFDIISGGESDESRYAGFKPSGKANEITIGTFIGEAKNAGYKRKHKHSYGLREAPEAIESEVFKIGDHIPKELMKELIQRNERLLVDAPTSSGKTTAVMNAFKELANAEHHYFIFCAPTIPLTEQIAQQHGVIGVVGNMRNLRGTITSKVNRGERVFVTTYDKAAELVSYLSGGSESKVSIAIDEYHKFTDSYNFRSPAIDRLEELSKMAVSLIALSGTPEDILKSDFNKLIRIEPKVRKSPCMDYRLFTYEKQADSDIMIIPVIRGLLKHTRVLLFLNSTKRIDQLANALRKVGIVTETVTAATKASPTYRAIVDSGTIADNVQVVISTTVMADGVSIINERREGVPDIDWSCLVVADKASPLWNPSAIRQMSNRFRQPYRYFGLYMQETSPNFPEKDRFFIESAYQYKTRTVKKYVDFLNKEFQAEGLDDFLPSVIENNHGIYYRNTEEEAKIRWNPLFVRHQAMKAKENYYSYFKNAFAAEVGRVLGVKCSEIINVNKQVADNDSDLSGIIADMEEEKAVKKLEDSELRQMFASVFDESIYNCFVRDDEAALKFFKKDVHPDQYAATRKNCLIADFETCRQVGAAISRKADIYKFSNDIRALADIASFDYVKKTTVTKRVFNELLRLEGKVYFSSDFKELVKELPKKLKASKTDVEKTLKLFHKFSEKKSGEFITTIRPLSVELVAKVRHHVEVEKIEASVLEYTLQRTGHQRQILLPAIAQKWGIKI